MIRFGGGIVALLVFVAVAFGVTVYVYRAQFDGPVSEAPAAWAQFGDYFGGVLNPIVGLAALGALLWTLKLQREELKTSIEELRRTAEAATKQARTAERQAEIMARSALIQGLSGLLQFKHTGRDDNLPRLRAEIGKLGELLEEPRDEYKEGSPNLYWGPE